MAPKSPVYNLYFYQNGSSNSSVNPEEVKIRKNELSLSIKKRGKSIYYVGKP